MYKKTTLIILIAMCSITQAFSQEEGEERKKKMELLIGADCGLALVQDKISPTLNIELGLNYNDKFKINMIAQGVFFFNTAEDNSRKRTDEAYYGIEAQFPGFLGTGTGTTAENLWSGIGLSYCPKPLIDLHKKNPFKIYSVVDFGTISICTEYIYSDFWYPGISLRCGF